MNFVSQQKCNKEQMSETLSVLSRVVACTQAAQTLILLNVHESVLHGPQYMTILNDTSGLEIVCVLIC